MGPRSTCVDDFSGPLAVGAILLSSIVAFELWSTLARVRHGRGKPTRDGSRLSLPVLSKWLCSMMTMPGPLAPFELQLEAIGKPIGAYDVLLRAGRPGDAARHS